MEAKKIAEKIIERYQSTNLMDAGVSNQRVFTKIISTELKIDIDDKLPEDKENVLNWFNADSPEHIAEVIMELTGDHDISKILKDVNHFLHAHDLKNTHDLYIISYLSVMRD